MKRKFTFAGKLIAVLLICSCFATPILADEMSDKQQEKSQLQNELTDVQSVIGELEALKSDAAAYVRELDAKVAEIQTNIDYYNAEIGEKQEEIDGLNAQVSNLNSKLEEQYAAMKLRIKFMYVNGNDQVLDTFLGSESFGEMLNKYSYLQKIMEYDRSQMDAIDANIKAISTAKEQVMGEQAEIEAIRENLLNEEAAVQALLDEKSNEMANYSNQIGSYEERQQRLERELAAVQSRINAIANGYTGGGYTGGALAMPLDYYVYISTYYGWREWDQSFHSGMDFAVGYGTPIKAAASGVVVHSAWHDDAGNFIIIYHGNGLYTEYMHASVRYAQEGDYVNVGDTIALVGSTGYSTGPHLHFGVVQTSGGYSTSGRVDPAPYLGL